jgi:hypothetical protein
MKKNIFVKPVGWLLLAGILLASLTILFSFLIEMHTLTSAAYAEITKNAESKSELIRNYLDSIESDIRYLQNSSNVQGMFGLPLVNSEEAAELNVDYHAKITRKNIENYIRYHPNLTLEDLQKNTEFRKIVLQVFGKESCNAIYDKKNLTIYLHTNQGYVGMAIKDVGITELTKIAIASNSDDSGGYFNMSEKGKMLLKYGRSMPISLAPADGIQISFINSDYIENYHVIDGNSDFLNNYALLHSFANIVLISKDGYVIYTTAKKNVMGCNLSWPEYSSSGLAIDFLNAKASSNLEFYGPSIERYGNVYPEFFAVAPVYDAKVLIGYVGAVITMNEIFKIVDTTGQDYETEENYLINNEKMLVSPVRSHNLDIMVQAVETENADRCFGTSQDAKPQESLNYRGNLILGDSTLIPKLNLCLLSEVNKEESVTIPFNDTMKRRSFFVAAGLMIFLVFGLIMNRMTKKKSKEKARGHFHFKLTFLLVTFFIPLDGFRILFGLHSTNYIFALTILGLAQTIAFTAGSAKLWRQLDKKIFYPTWTCLILSTLDVMLSLFWQMPAPVSIIILFGTTFLYYFFTIEYLIGLLEDKV